MFIRILAGWHLVIAGFAVLLYATRIQNQKLAGDILIGNERQLFDIYFKWYDKIDWFGKSLIVIAILGALSSLFLIIKKKWGRIASIVLGALLLLFGIILFVGNFGFTLNPSPSFIERIVDYFRYMGASLAYIDLVCILYGIFIIVYFTRENVQIYFN